VSVHQARGLYINFHTRFSSGEGRGEQPPETQNTSRSTAISDSTASSTQTGLNKVEDVVSPPSCWTKYGCFLVGVASRNLPRQSFVGHSGHTAEPT